MGFGLAVFLGILIAGLAAACIVLALAAARRTAAATTAAAANQRFSRAVPHPPAYSVADDAFAMLENAVAALESRLLAAEENTLRESRKNSDFVADISHQLKTPLAALRLYSELDAGKGLHSAEQLELTIRLEKLIQALLLMEKLKSDAYPMHFESCSLRPLVTQVWAELQPLFPDRRLDIRGDAAMRLDLSWMSEAVQNILKNACEQSAENPAIEVVLSQSEASVTLALTDHGGGDARERARENIRAFSWLRAKTRAPGHTGLGLAITRTIVEKHHGTIFAANTGDGLCLTHLPADPRWAVVLLRDRPEIEPTSLPDLADLQDSWSPHHKIRLLE